MRQDFIDKLQKEKRMNLTQEQSIRDRTSKLVLEWREENVGEIDNLDRQTSLEMVAHAYASSDESRIVLGRWIDAARRTGASWADIGDVMGISRQAAQQRFGEGIISIESLTDTQAEKIITREGATAFNEQSIMDEEGQNGRKLVACGILKLHFVETETQWEHCRVTSASVRKITEDMKTKGWTHVTSWFPFHYFRREVTK